MRSPPGALAIPDRRTLERVVSDSRAEQRRAALEDVVLDGDRRLILRSPNGHYWSLGISDAGAIVATDIGTQAP